MNEHVGRSRLFIGLSMAVFGTIGLFVRAIPLPSSEVALCRAVLATAAIGIYLAATGQKIRFEGMRRELILLVLSGIAMGFNWILLFEAYKYTTVSVATLSYYAAPVIITLVSATLFREKLTKRGILCFVMATLGILLIRHHAAAGRPIALRASSRVALGFLSAMLSSPSLFFSNYSAPPGIAHDPVR